MVTQQQRLLSSQLRHSWVNPKDTTLKVGGLHAKAGPPQPRQQQQQADFPACCFM